MQFKMLDSAISEPTEVSDQTAAAGLEMINSNGVDPAVQGMCIEMGVINAMLKATSSTVNAYSINRATRVAAASRRSASNASTVFNAEEQKKKQQFAAIENTVALVARTQRRCMVSGAKPKESSTPNIKMTSNKQKPAAISKVAMKPPGSTTASFKAPEGMLSSLSGVAATDDIDTTLVDWNTPIHTESGSLAVLLSNIVTVKMTTGAFNASRPVQVQNLPLPIKFTMPYVGQVPNPTLSTNLTLPVFPHDIKVGLSCMTNHNSNRME